LSSLSTLYRSMLLLSTGCFILHHGHSYLWPWWLFQMQTGLLNTTWKQLIVLWFLAIFHMKLAKILIIQLARNCSHIARNFKPPMPVRYNMLSEVIFVCLTYMWPEMQQFDTPLLSFKGYQLVHKSTKTHVQQRWLELSY
jgi:hypothetical protein